MGRFDEDLRLFELKFWSNSLEEDEMCIPVYHLCVPYVLNVYPPCISIYTYVWDICEIHIRYICCRESTFKLDFNYRFCILCHLCVFSMNFNNNHWRREIAFEGTKFVLYKQDARVCYRTSWNIVNRLHILCSLDCNFL